MIDIRECASVAPDSATHLFFRARTPKELLQAAAGLINRDTGIISRIVHGTPDGTDEGLPVCAAAVLRRSGYAEVGYGKGLTAVEAMIGAIGEALEIYSASQLSRADLRYECPANLSGEALDPRRLCLYEESRYDQPGFHYARFDPTRSIHWIRGFWLDNNQPVWIPALPTFRCFPAPAAERFCQVTSNGLAAGSNLEDASFRAALELVERDAFMLTWYCHLPAKTLMIDESLEPGLTRILSRIRSRGGDVTLYLLDVGIHIPTVLCVARGDGKNWPGITLGLGTHVSPRTALRKAVLELGQTGPHLCDVIRDGEQRIPSRPDEVRTFRQHALYYLPAERKQAFDFLASTGASVPLSALGEPEEISMARIARHLNEAGVRIAIADVTSEDVRETPFRIVRALGCDIQQIHFGFGLERTNNRRLKNLLKGPINSGVHPLC